MTCNVQFISLRCPDKEGQAHKAAATAAERQEAEGVDHTQSNKGKQVWYWMAAIRITSITGTITLYIFVIETEHPHAADDDPHKQECRDKTLQAATGFLAVFCILLVLRRLLLAAALDDIDYGGDEAEDTKDDEPNWDEPLTFTVVQID
jgi:hypothetical protein